MTQFLVHVLIRGAVLMAVLMGIAFFFNISLVNVMLVGGVLTAFFSYSGPGFNQLREGYTATASFGNYIPKQQEKQLPVSATFAASCLIVIVSIIASFIIVL
ncbi:hypothetical protein [Alkalicoccus halolimnae]|uniref:DUF3899 domain-containing protein n=1 Tax=Alkalicoccus halolimnae TaxID=1667239 RepID=A0A5C7FA27_9BACI|nr:hypothetical protein [Alkalicoccus halolimnae]TXF82744.1 hypothetical protein FTX54_14025 [Alkalicoccus halolimnae]